MSPALSVGVDITVTWSADETTAYAARLPAGPIIVLEGAGAVIWREATTGAAQDWVDRVADAFDVPVGQIQEEVSAFVQGLTRQGYLLRSS